MIDATNMVVDAAVCRITQNILNKNLNGRSIFLTHSFEDKLFLGFELSPVNVARLVS